MSNKRRNGKKRKTAAKQAKRSPKAAAPTARSVQPTGPRLQDPAGEAIELDPTGRLAPSQFGELGIAATDDLSPESIRAAFRARLAEFNIEADPERVLRLRETRDRLLARGDSLRTKLHTFERLDPVRYGLPPAPEGAPEAPPALSAHHRLMAGLALYALLEEDFRSNPIDQPGLFD